MEPTAVSPQPSVCMIAPVVTQLKGGMQRQLWLQSKSLTELGHRVYVLQRRDPDLATRPEDWSHVTFLECWPPFTNSSSLSPKLHVPGLSFVAFGFLKLFLHRREIDVVHAHQLYSPTLVGALAKFFLGKPLVVKVTASGSLGEIREIQRLPLVGLRKAAFRRIDTCVALTGEMKEELEAFGFPPGMVRVIPNGVSVASPKRAPGGRAADADAIRILFTGRLSEEKRLDLLIEAAARAARTAPAMRFEINLVGAPYASRNPLPRLLALTERHRGAVTVNFCGHRSDVSADYASADVFVLPSDSEGMSNALLEAMAQGLCCVASDIRPNRELIDDGISGLLFKRGDAESLAAQLTRLARDHADGSALARRYGTAARARILERHSTESVGEQLSQLYARLTGGPPP